VDAALGVIERGVVDVHDMIATQPWLPDGPIPYQVDWRAADAGASGPTAPEGPTEPSGPAGAEAQSTRSAPMNKLD
jgi:hypothetical protein